MERFPGELAASQRGDRGRDSALRPLLRALAGHQTIALLILAATLAGAAAWLSGQSPSYRTEAQLLVTPLRSNDPVLLTLPLLRETAGDPTRTVETAAALVDSQQAAALTASRLGRGWTASSVRDAVDVQPQGQTNILDITAVAERADEAARLATVFAQSVIDARSAILRPLVVSAIASTRAQIGRIAPGVTGGRGDLQRRLNQLEELRTGPDPTLTVFQQALVPSKAEGLALPLVVALTLVAGVFLAMAVVLLLDVLGPRKIADEHELLDVYRLPVLARVPGLPPRRLTQPDRLSLDPAVFQAFRSLQIQLEVDGASSRSILFTSPSQSDGKTSAVVDFALQLVGSGSEVIIVDMDLHKPDVAARLGMTPAPAVSPAVDDRAAVDRALRPVPDVPNLRLVEGSALNLRQEAAGHFAELLAEIGSRAAYVVIDVAPLGEVSDPLLFAPAVTDIIVVARVGNTRAASVETLRDLLRRVRCEPVGYLVIGGDAPVYGDYYGASEPQTPHADLADR